VIKYRGSTHGTNEYPFLIDEDGISVLPITSISLQHKASTERIPTGIARLDAMLGGAGYYCGSSVMVSGTAGTGKTSIATHFADSACRRGERVIYFAFEESPSQIIRNMRSIGIDLEPWVQKGLLYFQANRPSFTGLEMQLILLHKAISTFKPQIVIVDPLNSFVIGGNETEVKAMLVRLVDFLKTNHITGLFTTLTFAGSALEHTELAISSLIDTWLLLRDIESGGERNRGLYILKSRGMAHSNQIREFLLTGHGVELRDVYIGASGVLTGSARLVQEAQEQAAKLMRQQEIERRKLELERRSAALENQIAALHLEFEAHKNETLNLIRQEQAQEAQLAQERKDMGLSRKMDAELNQRKEGSK
jgi:circadian clock protein KaiC